MNFWFIAAILPFILSQNLVSSWCLPLAGSTACPSFAQYYAGMSKPEYDWLKGVWNVTAFDQAVNNYVHSTFWDPFNCTIQPSYARYTLSVTCELIINDNEESRACNSMYNVTPPVLCQSTCIQQMKDMDNLLLSQCQSALPSTTVTSHVDDYTNLCQSESALNGTAAQGCLLGMNNEPDFCGFSTQDAGCQYCSSSSDDCCSKIACDSGQHGLSAGAIAGIVIAVIICILLLLAAVYYYRRSRSRKQNHYQSSNAITETACIGDKACTGPALLGASDYYHASPAALRDTDSVGLISKFDNEFHRVIHQYYPTQPDELFLEKDDIIVSTVAFDDGWAVGVNLTTGDKGAFPLICVTLASSEALEWLLTEVEQNVDESASDQLCQIIRQQMFRSPPARLMQHGTKIPRRTQSIHSQHYIHSNSSDN